MLLPLLATIVKVTPSNCVIDYRFFIHFFPDGVSVLIQKAVTGIAIIISPINATIIIISLKYYFQSLQIQKPLVLLQQQVQSSNSLYIIHSGIM